jgi:signal transduction histidine kinase
VLLDLSGLNYLVFIEHGQRPTQVQWALAIAAFVSVLALHSRLLTSLLVQVALLAASFLVLDDSTISQVGTAWVLFELTIASRGLRPVCGSAALVTVVYLVGGVDSPWDVARSNVVSLVVVPGLPLFLGLFMRTTQELARQAKYRAAEEQRRREAESREARAEERAAIARELHDVVAHHVASMVLRVGVARHVLPDVDKRVAEVFDDVHTTGTGALADLRRLVSLLREPDRDPAEPDAEDNAEDAADRIVVAPGDLPSALAATVEGARRAGVQVTVDIDPSIAALDAVRRLAVLRLTQETLTNVAKHAGPGARASLRVTMVDNDLTWEITDDGGRGEPVAAVPSGGHGLPGMRERAQLLGGTLTAGPAPGGGWRVATRLPPCSAALPDLRPA